MVKKFVYNLAGPFGPEDLVLDEQEQAQRHMYLSLNDDMHGALNTCKDQITALVAGHKWDKCKRQTNEYELVFTSLYDGIGGVAALTPISRSYFKLWEIMDDYWQEIGAPPPTSSAVAVFLAEGPGGFMEAFAAYRARQLHQHLCTEGAAHLQVDVLHGMTLLQARNKSVPAWRVHSKAAACEGGAEPASACWVGGGEQPAHAAGQQGGSEGTSGVVPLPVIHLHRGADGTGDLYKVDNIDHMVGSVGAGTAHFVTADGGFDFSADYNSQEDASMRLILSELYAALTLQRIGGALVIKLYDIHAFATVRLLYILRCTYSSVRLIKPLTSRPANSEKYALATGFMGAAPELLDALRTACLACEAWASCGAAPDAAGSTVARDTGGKRHSTASRVNSVLRSVLRVPVMFVQDIVRFNMHFVARQSMHIARAIHSAGYSGDTGHQAAMLHVQLTKATRWCHMYGIPISICNLRKHHARMVALRGDSLATPAPGNTQEGAQDIDFVFGALHPRLNIMNEGQNRDADIQ